MSDPEYAVTVSGIMCAYNAASTIERAVRSVLAQTFTDWELIVIDDGSTDETAAIVRRFADPRIHVHRLAHNRGRGAARNEALRHARGRYIAICDSDDISLPHRFAHLVACLDAHPDIDVVSSQVKYFWRDETPRMCVIYPEDPSAIRSRLMRQKMAVAHGGCMIRQTCLARASGYSDEMVRTEDFELFQRICGQSRFRTLPEVLLLYQHELTGGSFKTFVESTQYYRYALYRARARAARAAVLPFDGFARAWSTRMTLYTYDALRFVIFSLRSRLAMRHVLR